MTIFEKIVFCSICGENLGGYKPKFAKEHLKKYPNHDSFIVMKLVDPLLLSNPDKWFKKHIKPIYYFHQPIFYSDKNNRELDRT